MRMKFNFEEFEVKVSDASFKCKEMDYAELFLKYAKPVVNAQGISEGSVDTVSVVKEFIKRSLVAWDNVQNENGDLMPFNGDNVDKLPFAVKQTIFNEMVARSSVGDSEKKS